MNTHTTRIDHLQIDMRCPWKLNEDHQDHQAPLDLYFTQRKTKFVFISALQAEVLMHMQIYDIVTWTEIRLL
jgi:hypothetical protein